MGQVEEARRGGEVAGSQTRPVSSERSAAMAKRPDDVSMLTARTRRGQVTLVRGVRCGVGGAGGAGREALRGGSSCRR